MVKMDVVEEFKNEYEKHVLTTNEKILENLRNKQENNIIATKENLSIIISKGLSEDLNTIFILIKNAMLTRYIDYIIRGMVENVIEYKFLILNNNLIEDYFGRKIEDLDINNDSFNVVKEIKKMNSKRYQNGRKTIKEMATEINEVNSEDGRLTLYDIFSITSEEVHNSYFQGYLNLLDDEVDEGVLTEYQVTLIYTVIGKFLDTYNNL